MARAATLIHRRCRALMSGTWSGLSASQPAPRSCGGAPAGAAPLGRTASHVVLDADLLDRARKASGKRGSALIDRALAALVARHRGAEVDASYSAYAHPLEEPDEWGDLPSFRGAVAAS